MRNYLRRSNALSVTMWEALKVHAAKQALAYAIALALALSASLNAFHDNFAVLTRDQAQTLGWWQLLALVAKCLNPGVIALVGYLMRSPLSKEIDPPTPATTK
jgi:hypothetical protein